MFLLLFWFCPYLFPFFVVVVNLYLFAKQFVTCLHFRGLREFGQWAMERLGSSLMNSLEVGAFFLQFLEWFYTSNSTPRSILVQPIPQPPQVSIVIEVLCKIILNFYENINRLIFCVSGLLAF